MTTPQVTDIVQPVDLGMLDKLRENMAAAVDFGELGIALAIVIGVLFVSHLFGKFAARRIARFVDGQGDDDVPVKYQPLLASSSTILRYLLVALMLLVALHAWKWQFVSELLIGFMLAFAGAFAVQALLRAVSLGFWTAVAASTAIFAFIFTASVRDVNSLGSLLDQVGFVVGGTRYSMLTLVNIVLVAIFLVALVRLGARAVSLLLGRNKGLDDGQKLLGEKLGMVALVIAAFFIGIDMLGIDLTAFAVFSGAFGLAIGFGLQKTFGNLIAGIILLMDRSIKPGDVIAVGDSFGWVNKIGTRAVSIITRDGKEHLIPNENLMTNEVENWSFSSRNVRVRIPVGVSYASDMDQVERLLLQAAGECSRVLKRPQPNVWMTEFGDSSVNFEILAWIRDPEGGVGNVRSEVLKKVWALFKEHDIEIPFPQRDINFRNALPPQAEKAKPRSKPKTGGKPKAKA